MTIICATHSYRGGTGKSNVTANLGVLLAQAGRRVAVVDADVPSPGIHVIFGLDPASIPSTLNDYLYGTCRVGDAAIDVGSRVVDTNGRPALHRGSLHLVSSSMRSSDISRIVREGYDVSRLNDGLYELIDRLKLDVLLIDTHPGLNEETLLSIAIADRLLLIVRPDKQDLQGTAVTVEIARKLEVLDMRVILNKVPAQFDEDDVRQKVERTFGIPVAAVLPLSMEMAENASSSVFALSYPNHALTQRLNRLAQTLTV